MLCHLKSAVPIQRCVGTGILQKSHAFILMPGLLLPMLALKMSGVEKRLAKMLTAPPKLAPFYN